MIKKKKVIKASDIPKMNFLTTLLNLLRFIGVCFVGFLIFYSIFKLGEVNSKKFESKIDSDSLITDGVVIKTGNMKGSYAVVKYFVNGKAYLKQEGSYADDVAVGQRFKVKCYRSDPKLSLVLFSLPFFNLSDSVKSVYGEIIQMNHRTIRFKYSVEGVEYKKFQRLNGQSKYSIGQIGKVGYLISNPSNAIFKP